MQNSQSTAFFSAMQFNKVVWILWCLPAFVTPYLSFLAVQDSNAEINMNVKLLVYSGHIPEPLQIDLGDIRQLLTSPYFSTTKRTLIYFPGFNQTTIDVTTEAILKTYLNQNEAFNIIQGNWTKYSITDYTEALSNIKPVGEAIANALEELITAGVARSSIILIGHSLGAQLVATVGRSMQKPLSVLVGLDPAGPGFTILHEHFKRQDADYTIGVYSDSGVYGTTHFDAHLNLFINQGSRVQPGCSGKSIPFLLTDTDVCSHQRSVYCWAKILKHPDLYPASVCSVPPILGPLACSTSKNLTVSIDQRNEGLYQLLMSDCLLC